MVFYALIVLGLVIGSLLGWSAFFKARELSRQLDQLRKELANIRQQIGNLGLRLSGPESPSEPPAPDQSTAHSAALGDSGTESPAVDQVKLKDTWVTPEADPAQPASTDSAPAIEASFFSALLGNLQAQWMIWLGGLCVALAGIFMVRYSIEQGYLGPTARIALALMTGIVLHGAAEWLRRHNEGDYQSFAALAGAASITLYAALLAALHLYQLISPLMVFVLLTAVSLLTMALAILHGPVLAVIGILGAYVVPLLVDTGSESITSVLIYSLIITVAALALMHFVYRYWIWMGMLTGAVAWWFMSLLTNEAQGVRGYYLAALVYLLVAAPLKDWILNKSDWLAGNKDKIPRWRGSDDVASAPVHNSILALLAAFGVSLLAQASVGDAIFYWTPIVVLTFLISRKRQSLRWMPWVSIGLQCLAWFALGLGFNDGIQLVGLSGADQNAFLLYAGWMAVLYFALSMVNFRTGANPLIWISLAVVAPLLWLALAYLLVPAVAESWTWGALAVLLGVLYLGLASWRLKHEQSQEITVWLILAGHLAYIIGHGYRL